jgi:hypothetical protein
LIAQKWKRIISMLIFSTVALGVILACGVGSVPFLSQAEPTPTRRATRVARATFTPRPENTATPEPSPTEESSPTAEPTEAPTDVPVTVPPPTRPPAPAPTQPPAPPPQPTQPPAPPQPTANPYRYGFVRHTCEHSGGVYVFVVVFSDYRNPSSQLAGARVIASYAPDSPAFGDEVGVTNADGAFQYTMSVDGAPPWTGDVYAWVVDANNQRISPVAGPVHLNGKHQDEPDTCWIAKFYFAQGAP